ncbi:Uncharacterised protein [Achromobacter sp. 2789STDY5608615]|uniref:hypothetical protein n=1 Tax=Achromobacter sp. 2789STDY5608615 TaxID=1806492 RepID=UPI0006C52E48|nr:hypothetical protein [Achromobacter sp. 2789STDY5608615]CUJ81874.1 Uncharacterised protein [Achromobacter sp. 2789STDY5608615]
MTSRTEAAKAAEHQTVLSFDERERILCQFISEPINHDREMAIAIEAATQERLLAPLEDYERVLADHRRLVGELDVLLNGDGAAPQASLCDIVAQVRRAGIKASAPVAGERCKRCGGPGWYTSHTTGYPESIPCSACNPQGFSVERLEIDPFLAAQLWRKPVDFADAYKGAREDLAIWKRRALEAERDLRAERETSSRLVATLNAENGATHMGEPAPQASADDVRSAALEEAAKLMDQTLRSSGAALIRGLKRPRADEDAACLHPRAYRAVDRNGYACPDCGVFVSKVDIYRSRAERRSSATKTGQGERDA